MASCTYPRCSDSARPTWDYGARGTLLGITRGTERTHVVRAVLEGVANRGADLIEAAEVDSGMQLPAIRIDGGMAANQTFVQALADASQRPIEVSPELEATTLGAGFLAGLALGTWSSDDEVMATWQPARIVQPAGTVDRDRWQRGVPARRRLDPRAVVARLLTCRRLEPHCALVPDAAPPPAPFDTDYAAFAESLELAMVALYNETLLKLTGENVATAARFRDHHQAHAQAYAVARRPARPRARRTAALIFVKTPCAPGR